MTSGLSEVISQSVQTYHQLHTHRLNKSLSRFQTVYLLPVKIQACHNGKNSLLRLNARMHSHRHCVDQRLCYDRPDVMTK
jgi:hypothetical protein